MDDIEGGPDPENNPEEGTSFEPEIPSEETEEDDPLVPLTDRLKMFLVATWRGWVCLLAPIVLILMLRPFPPEKHQWCGYTLLLMAVYWVTECVPLAVAAFLPMLIFPLTGVMDTATTCSCYMNETVMMFFGSLMLAYAVEQSGLHKRIALFAIRSIGYSHYRLLFAMAFTTMFVSMWITNTAATTMMVPINFALLKVFEDQNLLRIYDMDANGERVASDITTCYFCTSTFSATVGGIGTLVGTATNLVFKGLFQRTYPSEPEHLSFPKFSMFAVPYMLVMQTAIYFCMILTYLGFLRPNSKDAQQAKISPEGKEAAKNAVEQSWKDIGSITLWEILVAVLFGGSMVMFFCRSPQIFHGWGDAVSEYYRLNNSKFALDSSVAMLISLTMMLVPATLIFFKNFTADLDDLPKEPAASVLRWDIMNDTMPYSFMFLLGGGFALSEAAKKEHTNLNGHIGEMLSNLTSLPNCLLILLMIIVTIVITNFASNVAVCTVITPLSMQLAIQSNQHPLWYCIATGLSASYAMCLPVGTPGNLVVQGAAFIPTLKMIKAGALPTVFIILITWIAIYFWAPVVWPVLLTTFEAKD